MSNARNISKAESRFVNATGDQFSGSVGINQSPSNTEPLRISVTDQSAALPLRLTNTSDVADAITGMRLQGKDNSNGGDTVYTDFYMSAEDRVWGIGFGTSSANLPISQMASHASHADIIGHDAGYITMPGQVSFLATNVTDDQYTSNGSHDDLPFNSVSSSRAHNVGNAFNTSTHRFTAPIAGRYLLGYSIRYDGITSGYTWTRLNVNGASYQDAGGANNILDQQPGSYFTHASTTILNLQAGDYVSIGVIVEADSGWDFENASNFYGYLLG